LLDRYGSARPAYRVPGVDYYVGVPKVALYDPTAPGALPSCANYEASAHVVRVQASNCTLQRFDFTKGGGLQVQIPNGISNTTVTESRFGLNGNPAFSTALLDYRGNGLTVTRSTFQGVGQDPMYFDTGASGTARFEANYFDDLSGDALDFGSTQTVIVEHNAFVKIGMNPNSHPDAVQFCGGNLNPASHESYNLLYQPVGVRSTGNEGIQVSVQCGGTIDGYSADHNAVIAPNAKHLTMSFSITSDGYSVKLEHNYIDASGAYGPFYVVPKSDGSATCKGNVGLTAGSEYAGGQTYYWQAGEDIAGDFGAFVCT